jgi:hypothetical protein
MLRVLLLLRRKKILKVADTTVGEDESINQIQSTSYAASAETGSGFWDGRLSVAENVGIEGTAKNVF